MSLPPACLLHFIVSNFAGAVICASFHACVVLMWILMVVCNKIGVDQSARKCKQVVTSA